MSLTMLNIYLLLLFVLQVAVNEGGITFGRQIKPSPQVQCFQFCPDFNRFCLVDGNGKACDKSKLMYKRVNPNPSPFPKRKIYMTLPAAAAMVVGDRPQPCACADNMVKRSPTPTPSANVHFQCKRDTMTVKSAPIKRPKKTSSKANCNCKPNF